MADYDFQLAKTIINSTKELVEASMGMHEDWFWTAETVFQNGEYTKELNENTVIGGIKGSYWATPVLEIELDNGEKKTFKCYRGLANEDLLTKIEKQGFWTSGVLSGPAQELRTSIELIDLSANN